MKSESKVIWLLKIKYNRIEGFVGRIWSLKNTIFPNFGPDNFYFCHFTNGIKL